MKIQVNDDNVITSYAQVGDIEGSIEISDDQLPKNFKEKFVSGYYKLDDDGAVVVNENYKELTNETDQNTTPPNDNDVSMGFDFTNKKETERMVEMLSSVQKTSVKNAVISEMLIKQNADLSKEITQLKQKLNGGE